MTTDRPQVIASSVVLVCESAALWWYLAAQAYKLKSPLWHICSAA